MAVLVHENHDECRNVSQVKYYMQWILLRKT